MKKINKRLIVRLLFLLPLPVICILFFIEQHPEPFSIFPDEEQVERFWTYTDEAEQGRSGITDFLQTGNKLFFKYILNHGAETPYVGFGVNLSNGELFKDLSSYNKMGLTLSSPNGGEIHIYLNTYIEGRSSTGDLFSFRLNKYTLMFHGGTYTYSIPLTGFHTPAWWLTDSGISADSIGTEKFDAVYTLQFECSRNSISPLQGEIELRELRFYKNLASDHIFLALCAGIYYLGVGGFSIFFLNKINKRTHLPMADTIRRKYTIIHSPDKDLTRVMNFIKEEYFDPRLSSDRVTEETGISRSKIYALLKKQYNKPFKQVINEIRLTEAKRLLAETRQQVAEIAYSVGFNDISYFNRLFKKYDGVSPKKFREKRWK